MKVCYLSKDDFSGYFDFYKWSAPLFDSLREAIYYLNTLGLEGKVLRSIHTIGYVTTFEDQMEKILDAGIKVEGNDLNNYPYLDNIRVEWSVNLCEPIQFIFEDDTTLELLPAEGGRIRIGQNTIPPTITDGLNHANFDADVFFREVLGCSIVEISAQACKIQNEYIYRDMQDENSDYEENYNLNIRFHDSKRRYGCAMLFSWSNDYSSWYQVSMKGRSSDRARDQVRYSRIRAASKEVDQAIIINGLSSGGVFWIVPTAHKEQYTTESKWPLDGYYMSIDVGSVEEFLIEFLYRYFDPSVQERDEYEDREFDWFGENLYTFAAIRRMLADIRTTQKLLVEDFEHPALRDIVQHFPGYRYTDKAKEELTEEERIALCKAHVPIAVDFYERFCQRMENMLTLPGNDMVSFEGP